MAHESGSSEPQPSPQPTKLDSQLFAAARTGDLDAMTALLDAHPEKLEVRDEPYEFTLLHTAAQHGQLAIVDLLLLRGLDVNVREKGDNTLPVHWAAAAGRLDVVRRLADAGSDVIGRGDDHDLEVIGWTAYGDDEAHRAVADFLVSRGARHHIFSAIAFNLSDEVRRIAAQDPAALAKKMSRNENHQRPLHFAVSRKKPEMVALLLQLGADPLGTDDSGYTARAYAFTPDADRNIMEVLRERGEMDLVAALALREWGAAEHLARDTSAVGALHLMAKRGDTEAVRWLLDRGADPNALWPHWDSNVTALHLALLGKHPEVVRVLLEAGADPTILDTKHESSPIGWAEFFGRDDMVQLLEGHRPR